MREGKVKKMSEGKAFRNFVKERNEALLSLDKEKIIAYCKKYGVPVPENETVFWAGVHKGIIALTVPEEKKLDSILWLIEHGFSPDIN